MGWNTDGFGWIAAATAVAALLLVGAARAAAAIRLRRHRDLIADALERMCDQAPGTRPRLRGLAHDVVAVLARQDGAAGAVRAGDTPAASGAEDLALLIAADAATTAVESMRADQPDDSTWEEAAVAPRLREHPRLREVTEQMGRSCTRLIAVGRMVLGEGERFGLPEGGAKESLAAALERARLAVRDAERLAEGGDPLVVLTALTALDIPVPESGFPGQAVADELRTQVNALARLGLRHRTALSDRGEVDTQEERR
ncbi:hypothetical protein L6E12_05325 [Actinokineospora sp. PR83]|uniref:hypothetical protein n=1 Tax=Actinokineospora sp. PR83 TaxID=2884908 RepID=UPI001F3C53BE|nr:hypothetical protein [Actinokineospora sp. PR83]MCG8915210.1 hypothetical protein [Actinokineospora sp. PR83]